MISMVVCQRLYAPRKLFKSNLKLKILQSLNSGNARNLNCVKLESVLKTKVPLFIPKRNFFRFFRKPTKQELKIKDDVPDQYTLIYRSTMDRYILCAQIITTVTAFIVIATAIIKHDFTDTQLDFSMFKSQTRAVENEIFVYIATFIFLVVILQVIVFQLPIRIYNLPRQKEYIFIFYGNYPFTQRKISCKVGDVVPVLEDGMTLWKEGRYLIKDKQKLVLFENYFRRPADLYIMLGVQKDPDEEKE